MISRRQFKLLLVLLAWLATGCAVLDDSGSKKLTATGFIATPPSYYSTPKARYLGTKYKDNLDRLAERILRNASTSHLQFANNISSVGGIGFFTHSATKTPDERYLEVVLATPETFDSKGDYSERVNQLFSRYGQELLAILAGDTQIFQDSDLSGYGLNLTWRNVLSELPTNRITMARAIVYLQKEKVAKFLRHDLAQNELLRDAVIFAVEEDGPLNLVSYQPHETKPDFRPAIREDNLVAAAAEPKKSRSPSSSMTAKETVQHSDGKGDSIKDDGVIAQGAKTRGAASKPASVAEKPVAKAPIIAGQKERAPVSSSVNVAGAQSSPVKSDASEKVALAKQSAKSPTTTPSESKVEPVALPKSVPLTPEPTPAAKESAAQRIPEKVSEETPAARISSKTESNAKALVERPVAAHRAENQVIGAADVQNVAPKIAAAKSTEKVGPSIIAPAPTKLPEAQNVDAPSARAAIENLAETKLAPKTAQEVKPKPVEEIRKQESARGAAPLVPLPPPAPAVEIATARVPPVAKVEKPSERAIVPPTAVTRQSDNTAKASGSPAPTASEAKARDTAPAPLSATKVAQPIVQPEPVRSSETKRIEEPLRAATEKSPDTAARPKIEPTVPETAKAPRAKATAMTSSHAPQMERGALRKTETPAPEIKSSEAKAPPGARKFETPAPEIKIAEVKTPTTPAVPPPSERVLESAPARNIETAAPMAVAKVEPPVVTMPLPQKVAEKNAPEKLALLRKPAEPMIERMPLARRAPKALEGFIIQIAFSDKEKAQSWAEKMTQRGYAVSVTEAGAEGSLRVRLGNFPVRDDAERQLRNFKQEGMNGIIINLPQAFRPEARSSVP